MAHSIVEDTLHPQHKKLQWRLSGKSTSHRILHDTSRHDPDWNKICKERDCQRKIVKEKAQEQNTDDAARCGKQKLKPININCCPLSADFVVQ